MSRELLIDHLHRQASDRPDAPAYGVRGDAGWVTTSWSDFVAEVRSTARSFAALGVEPGDRVAVIGFNRPEWTTFALGAITAGAVPVGVYTTNSASELGYIVRHAGAKVLLVEDRAQLDKALSVRGELPALGRIVWMAAEEPGVEGAIGWSRFNELAAGVAEEALDARRRAIGPQDLATLIYTSGTTGTPKGVMLSHENVVETADIAREMFALGPDDTNLSYLPLSHIAEQMFTLFVPCLSGGCVYYAESPERIVANLAEVRPTTVFGVPRVWEKMHSAVAAKLAGATGAAAAVAGWARKVGLRHARIENRGDRPGLVLRVQHALADRLFFSKVKARLGLDRAQLCVSGAAPIAREVLEFFAGLDVVIREVYGQSEGSGPSTCNQVGATKFGTVGPPIPRVEVQLAPDGEVLVRGPNVFLGYFRDPEGTAETLIDGWLHSGDLGTFDEDGFLTITGRKKEILITSGGKNIAPRAIEEALKRIDLVAEAVAIGEGRRYVTALLVLDEPALAAFAEQRGLDPETAGEAAALRAHLEERIAETNREFARVEQVRGFHVVPEPFSIEGGELTPTLKLKRAVIEERYAEAIEAMYAG